MTKAPNPRPGQKAGSSTGRRQAIGKAVSNAVSSAIDKAGKSGGPVAKVTGAVAKQIAQRSPAGAALIGGAWVAHKLYKRKKERDEDARAMAAKPVKAAKPDKLPSGE